jgi:CRP-like cAMP-binding protein
MSSSSFSPSPSYAVLCAYLQARAPFTEEELARMQACFVEKSLDTGEFVQRAGDVPTHAAFVTKGCLRSYVIDAKGKEHIVQFAPETWWLADNTSIATGKPSQFFYEAIEPTDVLLLGAAAHQHIIETVPSYGAAMRVGLQKHAAAKDQRIVSALSATAEERYLQFVETYRDLALRVPQWMLASYLGISPETLSRIRKNLSRK